MGNRMYRSHSYRYAAEQARQRRQQEGSTQDSSEHHIKVLQKTLYSTPNPRTLLSFASFSKTHLPEHLEVSLHIQKSSVTFSESSPHSLCFKTNNITQSTVTIFHFAKELIDGKTQSLYFSLHPKSPKPVKVAVKEGVQEVIIKDCLNLEEFTEDELNFKDRSTFPLIIFVQTEGEVLLCYYRMEKKEFVKVRESYSIGNKSFEVKDVGEYLNDCCVICGEKEPWVRFYGCGHACVCEECFGNVLKNGRRCPMCRSFIFGWCNKFG